MNNNTCKSSNVYRQDKRQQKQKKIPVHYAKRTHKISFRNINLKVDHQTGGKLSFHGPKHRKDNQER